MAVARVSAVQLPPQVEGPRKGALRLRVGPLAWEGEAASPAGVSVAVRWWGDAGPGEALEPGAAAVEFPLHSGPKHVRRYLLDMGQLVLVLRQPAAHGGDGRRSSLGRSSSGGASSGRGSNPAAALAVLGTASVDVRGLGVGAPLSGSYPVVGEQGRVLGWLPVSMELDFSSPAVSSFELNEQLAANAAAAEAAAGPAAAGAAAAVGADAVPVLGVVAAAAAPQPAVGAFQLGPAAAVAGELLVPCTLQQLEAALAG